MTALASTAPAPSRYRPVAQIARGGMAEVVLALTGVGTGVEKPVVLKRIWPDLAEDPEFVAMFRDEARLATRLDHPNVVRTHELLDDGQQLAMAMEYLHGQPLAALLKRVGRAGQLILPLRIRILVEVLAGLSYAHDLTDADGTLLGVVHRDVSPENVFVTYDGQVKLMDFGVAQTSIAGHRTRPGTLKGKLSYLAPECIRGGGVDRRTDIFSAGIILWELLAARRLWKGMGEAQIIHHLAAGLPMPRLPGSATRLPELDAICARALAVDPAQRYATADEMEADLRGVLAIAGDSQPRVLGNVVSGAFLETRIEREKLISHALTAGPAAPTPQTWVGDLDALLPTIDGFFEETVVDEWVPPKTPQPAARRRAHVRIAFASAVSVALGLVVARAQRDGGPPVPATYRGLPKVEVVAGPPSDDPPAPTAALAPPASTPIPDLRPRPVVATPTEKGAAAPDTGRRLGRRLGAGRRTAAQTAHNDGFSGRLPDRMDDARPVGAAFDDAGVERLRPSAVRSLDESDPFK